MTASTHIADDLIVAYESGGLAEGWSLAVATHLALCPECRRRAAAARAVGGALLDEVAAAPVSDGALDRVMARIEGPPEPRRAVSAHRRAPARVGGGAVFPEPLRSYVGGDLADVMWRRLGSKAWRLPIATGDGMTRAMLLRIPAGEPVPEHGHRGRELTVVLAGSLVDGDMVFRRGEVEDADETVEHQPVAGPGEDCVCLAVTDAPLRFRNLLVRLAQPFLRI